MIKKLRTASLKQNLLFLIKKRMYMPPTITAYGNSLKLTLMKKMFLAYFGDKMNLYNHILSFTINCRCDLW